MDLFDYVMHTPQNTNPAVLSSEIQKLIDENIVQPDYLQADSTKKDYIKNRPCYVNSYDFNTDDWWVDILTPEAGSVIFIQSNFQYYTPANLKNIYSYEIVTSFPPLPTLQLYVCIPDIM